MVNELWICAREHNHFFVICGWGDFNLFDLGFLEKALAEKHRFLVVFDSYALWIYPQIVDNFSPHPVSCWFCTCPHILGIKHLSVLDCSGGYLLHALALQMALLTIVKVPPGIQCNITHYMPYYRFWYPIVGVVCGAKVLTNIQSCLQSSLSCIQPTLWRV